MNKHDRDNHANQLNPNNDAYWTSRGNDEERDDAQENKQTATEPNQEPPADRQPPK